MQRLVLLFGLQVRQHEECDHDEHDRGHHHCEAQGAGPRLLLIPDRTPAELVPRRRVVGRDGKTWLHPVGERLRVPVSGPRDAPERRRLVSERHPDNDLSIPQMVVLGLLVRLGEQTVGDLARAERVQPPSMTRTVNCLEGDGYVVRRPHDTDGRQVVVSLTDAGRAAVLADRQRRDAWLSQQLSRLTPAERATLREAAPILARLATTD